MPEEIKELKNQEFIPKFKAYSGKKLIEGTEFYVQNGKAFTADIDSDGRGYMQEHDWAVTWETGLQDNEGSPIYTGDIIWNGRFLLVQYESNGFESEDEGIGFGLYHDLKTKKIQGKIVGNIYINPEFNVWKK